MGDEMGLVTRDGMRWDGMGSVSSICVCVRGRSSLDVRETGGREEA